MGKGWLRVKWGEKFGVNGQTLPEAPRAAMSIAHGAVHMPPPKPSP